MTIVKIPRRSVRRHSAAIGISDDSALLILHKDLNFHPYKIAIFQELNDRDMTNRKISSEQLFEMLNNAGVVNNLQIIDEAHFHLSVYVNKQYTHIEMVQIQRVVKRLGPTCRMNI